MTKVNEVWYQGTDFDNSEVVTNERFNKDLGIADIQFHHLDKITPISLCLVNIFLLGGIVIEGSVHTSENFGTQFILQKRETSAGVKTINVQLPPAVQAQVLRCYDSSIQ